MAKILPLLLMIVGGAVGAGAGIMLKPEEPMECAAEGPCDSDKAMAEPEEKTDVEGVYYVAMKNQFVVPVIQDELVKSLVVLSLSLETTADQSEGIFSRQPKIRDVFLQVLFDHSHIGGFDGAFTESSRLSVLKVALLEAAQSVVGTVVSDVIITDIVRQEM
ncbi:MAG: flagellar basal body-associated FliL family protein [Paracoccaceae bacterium]